MITKEQMKMRQASIAREKLFAAIDSGADNSIIASLAKEYRKFCKA